MEEEPTHEQRACIDRAVEGHNFMIYGEAGTGKSFVISKIYQCKSRYQNVQIVCSTGIACEVFANSNSITKPPVTIHSFIGVGTAQGPFDVIVNKSFNNSTVNRRIQDVDCIIWDECSMASARLLDLFHAIATKVRGNNKTFGGIQTIIVGDWLQLKPVAGQFDEGLMMFKSTIYKHLIPHTIRLTVQHRQDNSQKRYKDLLQEIRVGKCSNTSLDFIREHLKRPLDYEENTTPIHLYFNNTKVNYHNATCLSELPGERVKFQCKDAGKTMGIKCPALETAYFKIGSPITCLYNINNQLHNGTRGTFLRKINDNTAVVVIGGGEYQVEKVAWSNVDDQGKVIGSRVQMPLKLIWSSTVHKAQGLQLPQVVVHSSYEFTGGLLYTALSRVKYEKDIQILGFSPLHIQDRTSEINEISVGLQTFSFDEPCTCSKDFDQMLQLEVNNYEEEIDDETLISLVSNMFDAVEPLTDEHDHESQVDDDSPDVINFVSLEDVLETVEANESTFSKPPTDFDYEAFITSFIGYSDVNNPNNFGIKKNETISEVLSVIDKFKIFVHLVWLKVFQLMECHLTENVSEVRFSSANITEFIHKTWDINRTIEFKTWLQLLFQPIDRVESITLTATQTSVGADIVNGVSGNLINMVAEAARDKCQDECSQFKVHEMDNTGKGKVRFVGAWAISKVVKKARKKIAKHLYSESPKLRKDVKNEMAVLKALESFIVIPYNILCAHTKHPETLEVTEERQYRSHGLTHVSDEFYQFMLELEQKRIDWLNVKMLKKYGEDLVEKARSAITKDVGILRQWDSLFEECDVEVQITRGIYKEVVKRYMNMGTSQFLRDFRKKWQVKKTMAHRNMVMVRKDQKEKKAAKVPLSVIMDDKSPGKVHCHELLKELQVKFGNAIYSLLYTRKELVTLCRGYGIRPSNLNKNKLGAKLVTAILSNSAIPYHWDITPLRAAPLQHGVGIRISRTNI